MPEPPVIHLHKWSGPQYLDSIEIGTAGKGGSMKVYFDANDVPGSKKRVDAAVEVRKYAQEAIAKATSGA